MCPTIMPLRAVFKFALGRPTVFRCIHMPCIFLALGCPGIALYPATFYRVEVSVDSTLATFHLSGSIAGRLNEQLEHEG
jgi:hypothetical protein